MAVIKYSPVIESMSGKMGNVVHYRRLGTNCVRAYVIPRNPDTPAQKAVRHSFADAVRSWQNLPEDEKYRYNRKARSMNMSGYNLYISRFMEERILAIKMTAAAYNPSAAAFSPDQLRFPSVSRPNISRTGRKDQVKPPYPGYNELLL